MHKCIFKKYSAGIIDQVDTLKWIAWFDSLSTEDRRELVNFVKNEREYKLWKTEGWDQKYNPELQEGAIKGLFGISKNIRLRSESFSKRIQRSNEQQRQTSYSNS